MRVPSNGSPVVISRGPTRAPDSNDSRNSIVSNVFVAGLRTVVMPHERNARPSASPKSSLRCVWISMRPGITVSFDASITVPACARLDAVRRS